MSLIYLLILVSLCGVKATVHTEKLTLRERLCLACLHLQFKMVNVRPLPPALAKAAKEELQEEPGRLEADLQHLREWLSKQPHLRARTDDQFLVTFLRGSKFSLERAKERLDNYYTLRSALPDLFGNRDSSAPEMQRLLKLGIYLPLGEDREGRRVILMRVAAYDPNEVKTVDVFKLNMMIGEMLMLQDDPLVVKGQVGIIDLAGMTVAHATHLTPSLVKRAMTVFQEAYPLRPKGINYLNMSSAFETIFNLFKSFMKEKLRKRISIHSDLGSLYKSVPKEILPKEYGGEAGTVQEIADRLAASLMEYREYFLEDAQYGADESKRPGKPRTHQDLFGLEGSFRPLNVD